MKNPEQWADMIRLSNPMFVEAKAYMFVGMSRERLKEGNMPSHEEVKSFALEIALLDQQIFFLITCATFWKSHSSSSLPVC